MKGSPNSITSFVSYTVFFIATTLFALVTCIFWFLSPLGLGFAQWPTNSDQRMWADIVYRVSYFVGIPLLVVGQVASWLLEAKGQRRHAYMAPTAAILFFIANVSILFQLLER